MKKRRKKEVNKSIILNVLIIILFLGFFTYLVKIIPQKIIVKSIVCQSQYGPCNNSLNEQLESQVGQSINDTKNNLDRLLSESIIVKQHSYQFLIPDKVKVNIVENKAVYALTSNQDSNFVSVTQEGRVISNQEKTNLPVVEIQSSLPQVGEVIDEKTIFALDLVYGVSLVETIEKASLLGETLEVFLEDGRKVIFPLIGDKDVLLGSLNLILSRLNSQDEKFRIEEDKNEIVIDLRFKNPVIK